MDEDHNLDQVLNSMVEDLEFNKQTMNKTAREIEWVNRAQEIQIEEILTEANGWGLRAEVITTAEVFIKDDANLDRVVAYEMAYSDWVK